MEDINMTESNIVEEEVMDKPVEEEKDIEESTAKDLMPESSERRGSTRPSRDRKQVERYIEPILEKKEGLVVEQGDGIKLGEIPNVAFGINKNKPKGQLLKILHLICFGRPGKLKESKKHIREFSGWVFKGDEEKERKKEKIQTKLGGYTDRQLGELLQLFGLAKSGTKDNKITAVMNFLLKPYVVEKKAILLKKAPTPKRKRKEETGVKVKAPSPKKTKREKQPEKAPKPKAKKEASDSEESDSGPSDIELVLQLKKIVKKLEDPDLVSVKMIRKELESHFGVSLIHKKKTIEAFIVAML